MGSSENQREGRFPIAGIGASAGGLEATEELLSHLPAAAPLAIVVVQHLDPKHESQLAELLARVTPLQVVTAADGVSVLPGCVYVIPPNFGLLIEKGILHLEPRPESAGPHMPIDRFFRSLAADRSTDAVGVILSGTGTDGTLGLKAIQAGGGVTFAQDATAKHDAMPRGAAATGCVDFVLPPDEIAHRLVSIATGGRVSSTEAQPDEGPDLARIVAALCKATGVDFSQYRATTIRRRIQRRILLNRLTSLGEYADVIDRQPSEATALADDMLIHVTSFFRDAEVFDVLKTQVFPRIVEKKAAGSEIRVWVPGCSTGEEVYSMAIALLEFLADAHVEISVKLFGTDISDASIEKARAGRYIENIALDVSPGRLQQYFVRTEAGYRIKQSVRDMCVFAKQDVTRGPPFSNMDLVSCRNLFIYLGPSPQSRVLHFLHYALNDRGFLLLGASESLGAHPGFTVVDAKHKIFAREPLPQHAPLDFGDPRQFAGAAPLGARPGSHAATQLEIQRDADRVVIEEYAPPGVVVTEDLVILQFRGEMGPYLQPATGVATFDLLRMAREDLRLGLRQTLEEARNTSKAAHRHVQLASGSIDLGVIPFTPPALQRPLYVVLFKEDPPPAPSAGPGSRSPQSDAEQQLRNELVQTREYLQSVIERLEEGNEELKAANEEVNSSNEELHSTNEELQTAKEELQAANEELSTVNQEMTERNREATQLNNDLGNVLTSVSIPIVLLGRDGKIRRFTPAAGKLLNLIAADVGRPFSDIRPVVEIPDLMAIVADVVERLAPVERTLKDASGRWYSMTVRPYVTLDNRIDGAAIVLIDVDALKKGEQALASARDYAENIVDTVREGLLVLDKDLRVRSANRPFCRRFGLRSEELVGRTLAELGTGQWNDLALAHALEGIRDGGKLDGFRLEREFPSIGKRVLLLNARRFADRSEGGTLLLLTIEDITDTARTEAALREMLDSAAEPILMSDLQGRIVFANNAAHQVYGFEAGELVGLPLDSLVPERLRSQHAVHRAIFAGAMAARPMGRPGMDLVGLRKNGTEFPVEVALTPMRGTEGALIVAFVSDISERKGNERRVLEYQEKLRQMAFDEALSEERERRRIAANLHDGVGQTLALAQIKLASARSSAKAQFRAALEECVHLIEEAIAQTNSLTFDLSPPILYDLGLEPALRWLAEQMEKRYSMQIDFEVDGQLTLDPEVAAMMFRSVRELLTNVFKHAGVRSAKVMLAQTGDRLSVTVQDLGVGFDTSAGQEGIGFGLFSVREQIERLGGSMELQSAPGQGTRVSLTVPSSRRSSDPPPKAESA